MFFFTPDNFTKFNPEQILYLFNFTSYLKLFAGCRVVYGINLINPFNHLPMETNKEIISNLKELLSIINDGKEGYESATEATDTIELQGVFLKYAAQRAGYAEELRTHIATHGADAENEDGGILGVLHRTWIDIKQALSSREDKAILEAIVTGEKAAIDKYDQYISDYTDHADHIELLKRQREGVLEALKEIEALLIQRNF